MADELRLDPRAVEWRAVEDEVVALALEDATYLGVNRSGSHLWALLAAGTTHAEMAADLVERYGIGSEEAAADTDAFVAALRDHGLLEGP